MADIYAPEAFVMMAILNTPLSKERASSSSTMEPLKKVSGNKANSYTKRTWAANTICVILQLLLVLIETSCHLSNFINI